MMGWTDGTYTECTEYLAQALEHTKRPKTIRRVVRHLKPISHTFDAVAVSGVSGLLIGVAVADKLGKPLIVVRKKDDMSTHSHLRVEGSLEGKYLIIDDLVCSGNTVRFMVESIKDKHNEYAECVGIYLWDDHVYRRYEVVDGTGVMTIPNCRKSKSKGWVWL